MAKNTIEITRCIDGFTIKARAKYLTDADIWECSIVGDPAHRDVSDDAFRCLADLIDDALADERARHAFNAGPFSSAQCA